MDIKRPSNSHHAKMGFLLIIITSSCFFIQCIAESQMPIIDAVKTLFSLPTSYDCWILKMKAFLLPPPPTFHGGEEVKVGTTEKVKDAAVKSLDKTKSTVEDSAISAARLAEEAVDTTLKKLKKTLSHHHHEAGEF